MYDNILSKPTTPFDAVRDGRRSPIFYFDVDLTNARSKAANTHLLVNVAGDSFLSDKNPYLCGDATVYFQDTALTGLAPAPVYVEPGFIARVPFTQLLIENEAQPGKILRVHYGVNIDFTPGASSSVNVNGSVEVIDGELARTLAGMAFSHYCIVPAGGAGNYGYLELWNPPANTKNVILSDALWACPVVSAYIMKRSAAKFSGAAAAYMQNKLQGGSVSSCEVYQGVAPAVGDGTVLDAAYLAAGTPLVRTFKQPFIIRPGSGMLIYSNIANHDVYACVQTTEESL